MNWRYYVLSAWFLGGDVSFKGTLHLEASEVWKRKNINCSFVYISFHWVWNSETSFLYIIIEFQMASDNLGFNIFMQLFFLPILFHYPNMVKRLIIGKQMQCNLGTMCETVKQTVLILKLTGWWYFKQLIWYFIKMEDVCINVFIHIHLHWIELFCKFLTIFFFHNC